MCQDRPVGDSGDVRQTGDGTLVANTGTVYGDLTVIGAPEPFLLEAFPSAPVVKPADVEHSGLSLLLRSASGVVPFIGRAAELARLSSWREASDRLSVMLIFGPGGQGKTRLAAKFAADSAAAGWMIVQARHKSEPLSAAPAADSARLHDADLLVVVDYAERWPRLDLLRLLQHRQLRHVARVRVLLLARPAGYWWKALANPFGKLGATLAELPLGPLADTVARRKIAFAAASNRFAELLGVSGAARLRPAGSLADDAYDLALTLHMSALVAVDAHRRNESTPSDPSELSDYLIKREYDHWQTMADNARISVPPRTMARLVALATLTQSLPPPAAVDLLILVGLAGDRAAAQCLLDDHATCYPGGGQSARALEPLVPDRLGEDFIAELMPPANRGTQHGDSWLAGVPAQLLPSSGGLPSYGSAVLSVLVETARRWEHVRTDYLVPLLLDRPRLVLGAAGAALVTLAGYADLELLTALDAVLPEQRHVELDSGIAALTRRLTDYAVAQTADEATRARLCDTLAARLSNAGLFDEAVSANQDAIAIRRRLARADPAKHEPKLADSLGNVGIDLWNVGRLDEALAAMTEAVDLYRRRADADPAAHAEDLGAELNNLAGSLIGVDRYADALAPAEEAAVVFRTLAEAGPGPRHELGAVLRNLAVIHDRLGRPEEALAAAQEAVDTYRHLVVGQAATYEVELADSLRSLGSRLASLQRHHEALRATEESVVIARRLATANPEAHEQSLALALNGLAIRLWRVGQRDRSVAVNEEAVELQRRLTEDNPRANERGLGIVLNNLTGRLLDSGRADEALVAADEALGIWQRLAAAASGRFDKHLDRATAAHRRAVSEVGRTGDA